MKSSSKLGSLVLVILLLHSPISFATTCVPLPPLKPVQLVVGIVFLPNGDRIAQARITVLQAGKEISSQVTGSDGRFSFLDLKPGRYEIRVHVKTLPVAVSQITLAKPLPKPKREIAINLSLDGCPSFSLVNPKKLEATLNPPNSQQNGNR